MVYKRKRNIKIDVNLSYNIFMLDHFNREEIEDYDEIKASGMEEEEEKEIHLQKIIKGQNNEIPLPVIKEIKNPCEKHLKKIKLPKIINWQKQIENKYIETEEDKKQIKEMKEKFNKINEGAIKIKEKEIQKIDETTITEIDQNKKNIEEEKTIKCYDFKKALVFYGEDCKYYTNIKNKDFIDFVLQRTIIRYDKIGYEPYVCFKNRILYPKTKSRKNEGQVAEKLEKLKLEFLELKNMCFYFEKSILLDKEYIENKFGLINKYHGFINSSVRRKILKRKPKLSLNEIFFNRKKVKTQKSENIDVFLNEDFFENKILNALSKEIKEEEIKENKNEEKIKKRKILFENRFECELN